MSPYDFCRSWKSTAIRPVRPYRLTSPSDRHLRTEWMMYVVQSRPWVQTDWTGIWFPTQWASAIADAWRKYSRLGGNAFAVVDSGRILIVCGDKSTATMRIPIPTRASKRRHGQKLDNIRYPVLLTRGIDKRGQTMKYPPKSPDACSTSAEVTGIQPLLSIVRSDRPGARTRTDGGPPVRGWDVTAKVFSANGQDGRPRTAVDGRPPRLGIHVTWTVVLHRWTRTDPSVRGSGPPDKFCNRPSQARAVWHFDPLDWAMENTEYSSPHPVPNTGTPDIRRDNRVSLEVVALATVEPD
ncbi:hypothetical protein BZA05DRAFT_461508 [Tricharina praecox]|uniref:uncharacterized protein n=1 Tax=Tricharina praecox TaxID=43433 RepID=UPI00221F5371|nr:uncharacterized protein BZA05DRAFT_461508 [Tricharina praecox]KAI5843216.1 hypothetical protein BZA05DRAFT_461508 [Tricharina praecox]